MLNFYRVRVSYGKTAAALAALALAATAAAAPLPFEAGGKWGYASEGGAALVPPSFDAAGQFSGGLAPVQLLGRWGYIDESGRFALRPEYAEAGPFSGGTAEVRLRDGRRAVIDLSGAVLRYAGDPPAGAPAEGLAAFSRNGRWGYLDPKGGEAVPPVFHAAAEFSEGLAAVRLNGRWGYIDRSGAFALWPEYDEAGPFKGGLAAVSLPLPAGPGEYPPVRLQRRWIDRAGRPVYTAAGGAGDGAEIAISSAGRFGFARGALPPEGPGYDDAYACAAGLCLVKDSGRFAFVTHSGSVAARLDYAEVAHLGCGVYAFRGEKYGLLGPGGAVAAPPVYEKISGDGCGRPDALLDGVHGRLNPADGTFVPGEQPVSISERCLQAGPKLEALPYQAVPLFCSPPELRALLKERPACLSCLEALAWVHVSSSAPGYTPDPAAADEALTAALAISSSTHLLRLRAGARLLAPELAAGAAEDLERLIALEPGHAPNYVSRALLRHRQGDPEGALEDLRDALRLAPADPSARLARARFSAELGHDYRAIFDCGKVLEAEPRNAEALELRAMACVRSGCCGKVLADLEAAGRARPGPGNTQKLAAYYWACEKDASRTAELAARLKEQGDACGGPCWPPAGMERYFQGFSEPAAPAN